MILRIAMKKNIFTPDRDGNVLAYSVVPALRIYLTLMMKLAYVEPSLNMSYPGLSEFDSSL